MKSSSSITTTIWCSVIAIAAVGYWYLLDSGFCFAEMRYLSDRELIVEAIRFNKNEMKIDGTSRSIDEFLRVNPKCCSVDRYPTRRTFLDVCLGFNISEVSLVYEQRYPTSTLEPFYENYFSMSSCGQVLKRAYGIGRSKREIEN